MATNTTGIDFGGDQAEAAGEIGSTFTWGLQSVTVVRSTRRLSRRVEDDVGVFDDYDVRVLAKVSDFSDSTLPDLRTVITLDGSEHYVEAIEYGEDDSVAIISLMEHE